MESGVVFGPLPYFQVRLLYLNVIIEIYGHKDRYVNLVKATVRSTRTIKFLQRHTFRVPVLQANTQWLMYWNTALTSFSVVSCLSNRS